MMNKNHPYDIVPIENVLPDGYDEMFFIGEKVQVKRRWFEVCQYVDGGFLIRGCEPPTKLRRDKTERNVACPCNSGKKYKRCCGSAEGESE